MRVIIEHFLKGTFIAIISTGFMAIGIALLDLIGRYPSVYIILFVLCMWAIGFFAKLVSNVF